MKRFLPDVNVWFALAVEDHPHHAAAVRWWDQEADAQAGFCRLTQIGLLRLLTTASAMGGAPLTNEDAWRVYDGFAGDTRVRLFPEVASVEAEFRSRSQMRAPAPKAWVDAYLAALAKATEAELVTFDQALRVHGPHCTILARV